MNKVKDLKNQRFGQLTVIGDYITIRNTRNRQERKWLCLCDCGTEKYILERSLLYGGTKSCGCLTRINSAIGYRTEAQRPASPNTVRQGLMAKLHDTIHPLQ